MRIRRWRGSLAEMSMAADVLTPSDFYVGVGGTFPTFRRADYTSAFRESGDLEPGCELATMPVLVALAQCHWHASGASGCTFAAHLSQQREEYGWDTYVITDVTDSPELSSEVSALCVAGVAVPGVEVVSVLLPELDDEPMLAALLAGLSSVADWEVTDEGHEADRTLGPMVRLGVRLAVELDHWSEVLGFGPFGTQPNTRLAPFTELAIRAKGPTRPRRDRRSYMANIPMGLDNTEFGEWWHETEEERANRLADDQTARGKAKATFSLTECTWLTVRRDSKSIMS